MSTVTTKKGISQADMDNAKALLKVVTPEKLMKKFNRNVSDNVKLDRFLSGDTKLPVAFRPEELSKAIDKLIDPKSHEHHGLVNVDQQKLILSLLEKDILSVEIAAKQAWLASFNMDEEQLNVAAEKLANYEKVLRASIDKAAKAWRKVYGE